MGVTATTLEIKIILGGPGHGQEVPSDWSENSGLWLLADAEPVLYERKKYVSGSHEVILWKFRGIRDELAMELLTWHIPTYDQRVLDAQLALLKESMGGAQQYTNMIMAVGYAALLALWNGMREHMTSGTLVASTLLLFSSVLIFVGWEIWGMYMRSKIVMDLASVTNKPKAWVARLLMLQEKGARLAAKMAPLWHLVVILSTLLAFSALVVMAMAVVHGHWIGRF